MSVLDSVTVADIQHEVNRVQTALRNNPTPHERFVLECQLRDYTDRLTNPDLFELKRREFFGGNQQ